MSRRRSTTSSWRSALAGLACAAALACPGSATASASDGKGLFGTVSFASGNLKALPQWRRVVAALGETRRVAASCDADIADCANVRVTTWRAKIAELAGRPPMAQLLEVQHYVNAMALSSDDAVYGVLDYWAAPHEFLIHGGDEEDAAIFKFAMLRELGFSGDRLRLVLVRDALLDKERLIVAAAVGGKWQVLESFNDSVVEEESIKFYVPYVSLTETTRWVHFPTQTASRK